jgi:transcriptional regulator with XRE-family HTH domain
MQDEPQSIRPTDLAAKLGVSVAYASQLLSGARKPSLELALRFFDEADVRLGPLVGATDEEIATLRKLAA